ncbi:hypothetical protein [Flavisolibacter ginsengisoli]|jgi:hypothetical protein|uniref:Uncharacterized protein n=1 Tax=Flavisolibacter ginsengisoli DSM 18119 TaxID=1121884 RepID=A0A1M4ZT58_9BACT|nr:hypothetical protein [Flavisolibacter ginsengisoli]SHF21229.1 hypothetical protein SAMN02745131_02067 [Flavisolibacter ginsengisoli DSM 18119]
MILRDFKRLKRSLQLELLETEGIMLVECRGLRVTMELYAFLDYYVEVFRGQENDKIIMIQAFDDTECLEPYLEQIDISGLVPRPI